MPGQWQDAGRWIASQKWPTYKAWLMSEMAEYMVLGGEKAQGLALAQRVQDVAAECENPSELANRKLDTARLLVWVGKPDQALLLIEHHDETLAAQFKLVATEAFLNMAELALAHARFEEALQAIEA